jgi:hypothetical protein
MKVPRVQIKVPEKIHRQWYKKNGQPRKLPVGTQHNIELMRLIHAFLQFRQTHKYFPKFEFDYSDDLTDYIYYSCNNEPGSDLEKF